MRSRHRKTGAQELIAEIGVDMARFTDLGSGWHDRLAPLRRKRQLIAELERLSGKKVLLQEEAAA